MIAKNILGVLAMVFLVLGSIRWRTNRIQARTWLLVGSIFAVVSLWLFLR